MAITTINCLVVWSNNERPGPKRHEPDLTITILSMPGTRVKHRSKERFCSALTTATAMQSHNLRSKKKHLIKSKLYLQNINAPLKHINKIQRELIG